MKEFASISAFARYAIECEAREPLALGLAHRAVAETIVQTAQSMIGHPSNFVPLKRSTVKERLRLGYTPYATLLRTGDYKRSFQWVSEGLGETVIGSDAPFAVYHELGTPTNRPPKRSVLIDPTRQRNLILFELFRTTYFVGIDL